MLPLLLGSAGLGAALGGLQSYQQSGGDLGKTFGGAVIGGGLGALVPGAGRMAGTALQGTGLLTPLAGGLTKAATAGRQALGLAGPAQAVTAGQLANLAGTGVTGYPRKDGSSWTWSCRCHGSTRIRRTTARTIYSGSCSS